jgi:hypothetical protein
MADDTTQRAAFAFLREHLQSQEPFTLDEFIAATGWEKPGTLNTYLRKQYKGLIEKISLPALPSRSRGDGPSNSCGAALPRSAR